MPRKTRRSASRIETTAAPEEDDERCDQQRPDGDGRLEEAARHALVITLTRAYRPVVHRHRASIKRQPVGTSPAELPQRRCERAHSSSLAAATTRERCPRSRRRATERWVLEELDREPALADEQLRRGDVDRPGRLEAADRVDASRGEMAERERERAHHADAMRDRVEPRNRAGDRVGRRPFEREDLDRVLRAGRVERRSVEERAAPALGDPLLPCAEVVDEAEARRRPSSRRRRPRARGRRTECRASRSPSRRSGRRRRAGRRRAERPDARAPPRRA